MSTTAKSKTPKVSINAFEKALCKDTTIEMVLDGTEDVKFTIQTVLPFSEAIGFIEDVYNTCIDEKTGEYIVEAYDPAVRIATLTHYANFTIPSDIKKQYDLAYNTHAYDQIMSVINLRQYDDIISTINKKIEFQLNLMASTAYSRMNQIIDLMQQTMDTAENLFADIDPELKQKFADAISKMPAVNGAAVDELIAKAAQAGGESDTDEVQIAIPTGIDAT